MADLPCPTPTSSWIATAGVWSACTSCGRLAWDHEQADPLADIRAVVQGRAPLADHEIN